MEETEEGTLLSLVCRHKHFPNTGTSSHQATAHQVQDSMRCRELAQGEPIPSGSVVPNIYSKSQCFHCSHRRSLILFSNVSVGMNTSSPARMHKDLLLRLGPLLTSP